MHDDGLDQATAAFLAGVRQAYASTVAPAARPALEEVFASGIASSPPVSPSAQAPTPSRRRFMFLDIFKGLPTKISAGALGAAIAVSGLGAGGALPVSMMLTSNEAPAVTEEVDPAEEVEEAAEVEEEGTSTTEPIDLTTLAVPMSVSEAAQTHAFDEACGNHGKYVSHFARFGEEPECATDARDAAAGEGEEEVATPESGEEELSTSGHDDAGDDKGKGKKARSAKSGNGGGNGKGGRR